MSSDDKKQLQNALRDLRKNLQNFKDIKTQTNKLKSTGQNEKPKPFVSTGTRVEDMIVGSLFNFNRNKKGADEIKPKIKEKMFDRAPNIIEWIINSQFLNSAVSIEFRRCMQVLHEIYELTCPRCNYDLFKNPNKMWDMKPIQIQNVHRFEYGICPHCGVTKTELRAEGLLNDYYEMIGVAGMRSGKSLLTGGLIGTYQLHQSLCYEDLPKYFGGMIERQRLTMTFIATSAKQGSGTVWEYFNNCFDSSPWFNQYVAYVVDLEKTLGNYNSGDLYKRNSGEVWFKNKNIYCDAANSNSGSLAGATRLLSVIDEFAKFDFSSASLRGADEVYRMMKKSLRTIRSLAQKRVDEGDHEALTGMLATCSSPISQKDKLMQQYAKSKNQKKVFAFKYSTWEFNPTITRDSLNEEYADDYIGASRDYGCEPPGGRSPYITNLERITSCQDDRKTIFKVDAYNRDAKLQDGSIAKYVAVGISECLFDKENIYVIALDPGLKNHGFGICVQHIDKNEKNIFKTTVDGVIELLPLIDPTTGIVEREIDFLCINPIVETLCRNLNVRCVTIDRWNSETMIQQLQTKGIPVKKKNTAYTMYDEFRRDFNSGNIRFIKAEIAQEAWDFKMRGYPNAKVLLELMTLEDLNEKIKPSKGGSDDIIQTVVRGAYLLREIFTENSSGNNPGGKKVKRDLVDVKQALNRSASLTTRAGSNHIFKDNFNGIDLNARNRGDDTGQRLNIISMSQKGIVSGLPFRPIRPKFSNRNSNRSF